MKNQHKWLLAVALAVATAANAQEDHHWVSCTADSLAQTDGTPDKLFLSAVFSVDSDGSRASLENWFADHLEARGEEVVSTRCSLSTKRFYDRADVVNRRDKDAATARSHGRRVVFTSWSPR